MGLTTAYFAEDSTTKNGGFLHEKNTPLFPEDVSGARLVSYGEWFFRVLGYRRLNCLVPVGLKGFF
jgi:hypothetical protein